MARTQVTTREIGNVQRNDFDIITTGQAVITKVIAGTNITISQTGVDAGTGDVTINSTGGGGSISLSAIGSTPNANAATLTGSVLNLEPASDTFAGVVTTGLQIFAGSKSFLGSTTNIGDVVLGASPFSVTQNSASATTQLQLKGSTNINFLISERWSTSSTIGVGNSWASHIIGVQTVVESASGVHDLVASLAIKGIELTDGGATTTNAASLYVEGPATGTATVTNKYSFWVGSGISRFDGNILSLAGGITSNANPISVTSSSLNRASLNLNGTSGQLTLVNSSSSLFNANIISGVLTASRTYTLPNNTGTIALTSDITALSLSAISSTPNANGATITGSVLNLQPANGSFGGVLSDPGVTQTIGGDKIFQDSLRASNVFTLGVNVNDHTIYGSNSLTSGSGAQFLLPGASTISFGFSSTRTISSVVGINANYTTWILGANAITESASGVHHLMANIAIKPLNITDGVATTTNTASLYIEGAATIGTNNYSLWIDDGALRFDGPLLPNNTAGTSGQVLTSAGAGAVPTWTTVSGGSGITRTIVNISTNTTAAATANVDYVYNITGTTTLTLPTAVGNTNSYKVKRKGTNTVTILFTSGQNADESTTINLNKQYESLEFISDGSNWNIY